MGWSSPAPSASSATAAGYRPYEGDSRRRVVSGVVIAAVLAIAGVALELDPSRLAGATLVGVILLGPVHAWTELRRLRTGLETARTGPLPMLEDPREDAALPRGRSLGSVASTILVVLLVAAFAGYVVFSFTDAVPIVLGGMAGLVAGEAVVLAWLRRRRARDGMQIYVRDVEGDEETADPPRLHQVPRGR